jgi:hypothetical protein
VNTREKAGAILSAAKMRMLEAEGITVVTKERLEALERLHEETKRHMVVSFTGSIELVLEELEAMS